MWGSRWLWSLGLTALIVGIGTALALRTPAMPANLPGFHRTGINPDAVDPSLRDHTGRQVSLGDYRSRVMVISFGFARCPDVCPTQLFGIAEVARKLGADAARVSFLFVTLDPERDTPELLQTYLAGFHPDLIGITGERAEIDELARRFYVVHRQVPIGDDYTIDHSTAIYLMAPGDSGVYLSDRDRGTADLLPAVRELLAAG